MAFHPSPNFRLNFRTSNRERTSTVTEENLPQKISQVSNGPIAPRQREVWIPAMKENWQEYARQTKQLVGAVETLFPKKVEDASFEKFLGTLANFYGDIHEALTRFDRSDKNLAPPEEIAKLLEVTNESLRAIVFQAAIARQIVTHSRELHRLVEELFQVKRISNAFLGQLVIDIRLGFSALQSDLAPVLHPAVAYEDFLPVVEWQSEPQVYGQGIQTALLLLHLIPEVRVRDDEIDKLLIAAIMQDIGLLALEKIHRQASRQIERSASELFELHPRYSVAMLSGVRDCPVQVLKMVGEHHERDNGTGYPTGESSRKFSNCSRWLALAARFVSRDREYASQDETTNLTLSSTDFMHTTCEKIRTETLRERFDFELTHKFIEAMNLQAANRDSRDGNPASGEVFDGQYRRSDQAEKLLPQPQLLTALGLSKVKPRFSSPS